MNLVLYKFSERKPERAGMYLCGVIHGEGPDARVTWYDLPYSLKYQVFNAYDSLDEALVAKNHIDVACWCETPRMISDIIVADAQ
ncbi:MAG: hypothetical protein WC047_00085 [Kiritimatiellales bacterium]